MLVHLLPVHWYTVPSIGNPSFWNMAANSCTFNKSALVNITGMLLAYINLRGYFPLAPLTPPYDRGISTRILSA